MKREEKSPTIRSDGPKKMLIVRSGVKSGRLDNTQPIPWEVGAP
jgi:hypothetical protein